MRLRGFGFRLLPALVAGLLLLPAGTDAAERSGATLPATADAGMTASDFPAWLAAFADDAVARGADPALVERALADVTLEERVLELAAFQPEFVRPVWDYIASAASDRRVRDGRRKAAQHAGLLAGLAERHGVPAETLLAIWGVESGYGAQLGSFDVFAALATVAFAGRRTEFAERELFAALAVLAETGGRELRGSWAGAMGHVQFLPSSFLAHAVDYDGDGRRDIWADDPADALASAANYLAESGWRRGEPVALEVVLPDGFDYRLAERDHARGYAEWLAAGLRPVAGAGAAPPGAVAQVLTPAGAGGPAFLAFANFAALLAYNNATSYALAVWQLGERIAGRPPVQAAWPTGSAPIRVEEVREFQALLTALGHDPGGVDGLVGPATRAAIRGFQESLAETPDGHVTRALIEAARRAAGR